MSLIALGWLFTGCALLHNLEEALYLPAWSRRGRRFLKPVTAPVFRFAISLLSLLFVALTLAATVAGPGSVAAYLMAGYVLAMVLNALLPHALATMTLRSYMPGTATGVLFNLPIGLLYLSRALGQGQIALPTFYRAGPAVVLGLLGLLPVLFALGNRLQGGIDHSGRA